MTVRHRLEELIKDKGIKKNKLAEMVGTSPSVITELCQGRTRLNSDWIESLSNALGVEEYELFAKPFNKTLVLGEVWAETWRPDLELDSPIDELVNVKPPDKYIEWAYALRVRGDSMNLVYPEGTNLICVPWQYGPSITNGKHIIARRTTDNGYMELTVKEYRYNKGQHELWPRSTDPMYQKPIIVPDMVASQRMNSIEIIFEAVVISSYREETV